ncbi:MAG: hypothetical protein R3A11_02345 [Bdellovibrionota bacterium]
MWSKKAFIFLVCLWGCGSNSATTSVQGVLVSVTNSSLPASPDPVIKLSGRNASEFDLTYQTSTSGGNQKVFTLDGVVGSRSSTFEVSHAQLATTVSYSLVPEDVQTISLAAMTSAAFTTTQTYGNTALNPTTVDTVNKATVMGQVSPSGGGCGSATSVSLLNASDASPSTGTGSSVSLYFNSGGTALVTGGFADDECNFVIFNVAEGSYVLRILSASSSVLASFDVVAVKGKISFGVDLL